MLRLLCLSALTLWSCGPSLATADDLLDEDGLETSELTSYPGLVDGSPDARGLLRLANEASQATLRDEVGVPARTARAIVTARAGGPFTTLRAFFAVRYVGAASVRLMLDFARAHGFIELPPGDCGRPDVAGCGRPVTLEVPAELQLFGRVSAPVGLGTLGSLWAGTARGEAVYGGAEQTLTAWLETSDLSRFPLWSHDWRAFSLPTPVVVMGHGGAPGTDLSATLLVGLRRLSYEVTQTREYAQTGTMGYGPATLARDLDGLALGFELELETHDHFQYPCPVVLSDRNGVVAELSGEAKRTSLVQAVAPLKLAYSDASCGVRRTNAGPDFALHLRAVRIWRP